MTMRLPVMDARRYLPTPRSTVFLVGGGRSPRSGSSSQARLKASNGHAAGKMGPAGRLTSASGITPRSRSSYCLKDTGTVSSCESANSSRSQATSLNGPGSKVAR